MVERNFTGPEKSAIVLLALGEDIAPLVFRYLDDQEVQLLSNYMSDIRNVDAETVKQILEEFTGIAEEVETGVAGGKAYVRKLLQKTFDAEKVAAIVDNLSSPSRATGLAALRGFEAKTIARYLQDEHPQTIAVILAQLEPVQASTVVSSLPGSLQVDVLVRLAKLDRIPARVLQDLDSVLSKEWQLTESPADDQIGGARPVAQILNKVGETLEHEILNQIEQIDPALAEEINQLMFTFEDLLALEDRGIQQLLKELTNADLLRALKIASDEMKHKIFRNMSERAAEMLREELEIMGPVRIRDAEESQQMIIQVAKRLETEGRLVIGGKGGDVLI